MTPEYGFGMLLFGFACIAVGAVIAYYIINYNEKK